MPLHIASITPPLVASEPIPPVPIQPLWHQQSMILKTSNPTPNHRRGSHDSSAISFKLLFYDCPRHKGKSIANHFDIKLVAYQPPPSHGDLQW
jgi:hypothetical protein